MPATTSHAEKMLRRAFLSKKFDSTHFTIVNDKDGPTRVHCLPCKQTIKLGKGYKALDNLIAHNKRKVHTISVMRWQERKLRKRPLGTGSRPSPKKQKTDNTDSGVSSVQEEVQTQFGEVQKLYGTKTFQLMPTTYEIMCSYCLVKFQALPKRGDLFNNLKCHVDSEEHRSKSVSTETQGMIASFFKHHQLPGMNRGTFCYGYYHSTVQYAGQDYNIEFLYDQQPAMDHQSNPRWCIEKHTPIPDRVSKTKDKGTVRSVYCAEFTLSYDSMCTECRTIPNIPSLRMRVLRKQTKPFGSYDTHLQSRT